MWPQDWHYSLKPKGLLIDTQVQIMIVHFRIHPYMSYFPMHDWLLEDLFLCRLSTGRTGCEIWVAMTISFPKSAFPSTALLLLFLQEISLKLEKVVCQSCLVVNVHSLFFFPLVWAIKTINLNRIVTREIADPRRLCILNKNLRTTFIVVHCK